MEWINTKTSIPSTGAKVMCRLKHFHTGSVQEHILIKVDEGDCDWRTADDHSEISYSWDVIQWKEIQ